MLDTGYSMLNTGYWILDTGYWILDTCHSSLVTGYWKNRYKADKIKLQGTKGV